MASSRQDATGVANVATPRSTSGRLQESVGSALKSLRDKLKPALAGDAVKQGAGTGGQAATQGGLGPTSRPGMTLRSGQIQVSLDVGNESDVSYGHPDQSNSDADDEEGAADNDMDAGCQQSAVLQKRGKATQSQVSRGRPPSHSARANHTRVPKKGAHRGTSEVPQLVLAAQDDETGAHDSQKRPTKPIPLAKTRHPRPAESALNSAAQTSVPGVGAAPPRGSESTGCGLAKSANGATLSIQKNSVKKLLKTFLNLRKLFVQFS